MNRFLNRLFGRNTARAAKSTAKTSRLRIEQLEDRLVPAFLNPGSLGVGLRDVGAYREAVTGFANALNYSVGADRPQLVAAGNFNIFYDNYPDLFVTNKDGSYTVLLGNGAGGFSNYRLGYYGIPDPRFVSIGGNTRIDGLGSPEGVVAGDFNGDGLTDVAVAGYGDPGAVKVLLGFGNGQFAAVSSLQMLVDYDFNPNTPPSKVAPTYLAAADLDKDGITDLVVSDYNNNKVVVYRGQGDGTFVLHDWNFAPGSAANPNQVVVADFNADGNLDIAVANTGNGTVSVFRGTGGGYITFATSVSLGTVAPIGLAAGDLNGDGMIDLAVANYGTPSQGARTLSLLPNTGTPGGAIAFVGSINYRGRDNLGLGDHLLNVVIADFDGDGRADLAVTSAGNTLADTVNDSTRDRNVYLLFNRGQFAFEEAKLPLIAGFNPVGLIAADLDFDGDLDLVSANQTSDSVSVFRNRRR